MSSDLYLLEDSFLRSSFDLSPFDVDSLSLSDPFATFPSLSVDVLQQDQACDPGIFVPSPFPRYSSPVSSAPLVPSPSPPCSTLQSLSLSPSSCSAQAVAESNQSFDFSDRAGVESELNVVWSWPSPLQSASGHGFGVEKGGLLQRSLSTKSLDRKPSFHLFQPQFWSLSEAPKEESQVLDWAESRKIEVAMRRAASTGDLYRINGMQSSYGFQSSFGSVNSYMDEAAASRVGRYSVEERKQRIHRYRSKRNQRNYNKTIKYACRKTLADSRPRIRGRFARNDETGETPKATVPQHDEDENIGLWTHELPERLIAVGGLADGMNGRLQYLHF